MSLAGLMRWMRRARGAGRSLLRPLSPDRGRHPPLEGARSRASRDLSPRPLSLPQLNVFQDEGDFQGCAAWIFPKTARFWNDIIAISGTLQRIREFRPAAQKDHKMRTLSRRVVVAGLPLSFGACAPRLMTHRYPSPGFGFASGYGPIEDDGFLIPPVNTTTINPAYLRQEVSYEGHEAPGTLIVDPGSRHLHYVQGAGRAIRYGVGVGREGFGWSGVANVRRKSEWPNWTPPPQMIRRQPELEDYAEGMPGGLDNPLGARAMYLYQGTRDTLYRIHGTNEPWTIGTRVSSGCIRLINQDVIDLYDRVRIGSKVVVLGSVLPAAEDMYSSL